MTPEITAAIVAANDALQQARRVHRAETPPHILAAIAELDTAIASGDAGRIVEANDALQTAAHAGEMPWGVAEAIALFDFAVWGP